MYASMGGLSGTGAIDFGEKMKASQRIEVCFGDRRKLPQIIEKRNIFASGWIRDTLTLSWCWVVE